MIVRSEFFRISLSALLGILLSLVPFLAQGATVGVLLPGRGIPYYQTLRRAMVAEFSTLGADVDIVLQRPAPAWMAWKNATRKLVVYDSDVIVAYGTSTALAVTSEAEAIPLVYCAAYDPVGCGIGADVSGVEGTFDISGLIKDLKNISHFKKLAILFSHEEPDSVRQMKAAKRIVKASGATVKTIETHDLDRIDLSGNDAVFLTSAANINTRGALSKIVAQARVKKIATAAILGLTCEQGVLISRYDDPVAQGKQVARIIVKVIENGGSTVVRKSGKIAVVTAINISEAKKLGLIVPFDLLGRARVVK